ncbi:hypothetical protein L202_00981 [Cryptococcus amylolentus CBS 6039]|uniref:Uncharacterized protein n=2 Tax=Cryptococcus amylolentus TaxID=104669 RepID=A0A1E3I2B4_9TREE|nr:hypothetical protein L202_00981 [Cryptococcus amylolentus CBS 6039]ODN82689.1 hypothetical protein L202_00981 [Cryptococcus amylolentus CBS 6039]ODO10380.1 hypothetical protein I350_00975 [Cryptococcus amylolentus CBS 6273]
MSDEQRPQNEPAVETTPTEMDVDTAPTEPAVETTPTEFSEWERSLIPEQCSRMVNVFVNKTFDQFRIFNNSDPSARQVRRSDRLPVDSHLSEIVDSYLVEQVDARESKGETCGNIGHVYIKDPSIRWSADETALVLGGTISGHDWSKEEKDISSIV